jgi:hypothetical protein
VVLPARPNRQDCADARTVRSGFFVWRWNVPSHYISVCEFGPEDPFIKMLAADVYKVAVGVSIGRHRPDPGGGRGSVARMAIEDGAPSSAGTS